MADISISASSYPLFSSIDASTKPIVAVKITPATIVSNAMPRHPFHLTMLLDVSGSMDGERIDAVRRTLHLLVDAMSENDILTLITYNHEAKVCADSISINQDSRVSLHSTIDDLNADGGTNMEAAINKFLTIATNTEKPAIDAVFILTDGHINAGLSSSAGLLRLLQNQMNQGIQINTLGYGAEHNSHLLRDMALRGHGSYTFADVAEVLPAIIGDIIAGLKEEVGRQAKLVIPEGWTCLELQTLNAGAYCIGTLIAEKPQWVVLEGPPGATSIPSLECIWLDSKDRSEKSATFSVDTSISMLEIMEQRERCRVANVFAAVTEDIEALRLDDARTKLNQLSRDLSTSLAKDTPFVIRLQAQVDDMIESLKHTMMPPAVPGGGGLQRSPAGIGLGPLITPVLSRLASGTVVLGNQRGIMSGSAGVPIFSSPSQQHTSSRLTNAYSGV
jgi:uncharacterized protein YegL